MIDQYVASLLSRRKDSLQKSLDILGPILLDASTEIQSTYRNTLMFIYRALDAMKRHRKKEATQLIELASQETQGESQNLLKALLWAMQDREAKQARKYATQNRWDLAHVVYLALFSKEYASSDFRYHVWCAAAEMSQLCKRIMPHPTPSTED